MRRVSFVLAAMVSLGAVSALTLAAVPAPGSPPALGTRQQSPQMPLAPVRASGQTVTPAFEGWYENPDGTLSLSFGYYNRNTEEVIDISIGDENFIS